MKKLRTVRAASEAMRSKSGDPGLTWPSTALFGSGSRAAVHEKQRVSGPYWRRKRIPFPSCAAQSQLCVLIIGSMLRAR